jgi:TRAP-type C4-dicarboxylate transport system permease small subunit
MLNPPAAADATERSAAWVSLVFYAAVAVTAIEVVLRYVFGRPTIWAHEATVMLCAIGYLAGGIYAMHRDDHIRISFLYDRLPPAWRRFVDCLNTMVVIAFLLALAASASIAGWRALWGWETTGSAWDPPIPALITPLTAVVAVAMIPYALRNLHRRLRG